MVRLLAFSSRFQVSTALALATLAFLAVPGSALADADWCSTYCTLVCDSEPPVPNCETNCNQACDNGWSNGCSACSNYVGDQYTECMDGCNAAGGTCRNTGKNSSDCSVAGCRQKAGDPTKCVNPGREGCDDGATCVACLCDYRAMYDDCLCW